MTTPRSDERLERLDDSDLELAPGERDLRGAEVVDAAGEDLGKVHGLLVDTEAQKIRFLDVRGGGFFGIGDDRHVLPVEAVDGVDGDRIRLRHTGADLRGAPGYEPDLVDQRAYWDDVYGRYGYSAPWGNGVYPGFMYYGHL